MPRDIESFFNKEQTYADKRKAALEKRQQLLKDLHIDVVTSELTKAAAAKKKKEKEKEKEVVVTGPVRKSRRLMGEKPEIMPDDFYLRESHPYIPPKSDKELLLEVEGTISYDGDFNASDLAKEGDMDSFFAAMKSESVDNGNSPNLGKWASQIQFSGAKKVLPGRIYSMAIHPQTSKLMMAAGDKDGRLGFWSLPHTIDKTSLPELENGMLDISELGDTWQFKLSHEPITRLFYSADQSNLFCCSYDKTVKRFDLNSMKVETIFKVDKTFDSEVFIHHCITNPSDDNQFYISLGNGEILLIDSRSQGIQASFQAHDKKVNTIDIHGNLMLTASLGRSVKLFDIRQLPTSYKPHIHEKVKDPERQDCLHTYNHALSVNSAFFNQNGDMIVTTCQDNTLRVYPTLTNESEKDHGVFIQHRNNTGKWLTKLMAEWYIPSSCVSNSSSTKGGHLNYFVCGSMDEPRQVNLFSVVLHDSKQPVVKALPSLFSPHIASVQSVVKTHPSFPLIACGNTSGRIVVLMNNLN